MGSVSSYEFLHMLWGKSRGLDEPYPLIAHLIDTAAVAKAVTELVIPASLARVAADWMDASPEQWSQTAVVLAGWHDIGKASCKFQNQDKDVCPDWLKSKSDAVSAGRHDKIGAHLTWDRLDGHQARYRAAQIIGGHHGTIPHLDQRMLNAFGGAGMVDKNPPQQLIEARRDLWDTLNAILGDLPEVPLPTPAASTVLAVVVLADWIASSAWFLGKQQKELLSSTGRFDPSLHFQRASLYAREGLLWMGLKAPKPWRRLTVEDMFGSSDQSPRWTPLQESIDSQFCPSGPGIAVICAPTGEGKTEAALLAASKFAAASDRHGLFFAMPTVATAEGLHDRVGNFIAKTSPTSSQQHLRRVHSQAMLYDDNIVPISDDPSTMAASAQWLSGTRKSILAPFGVGTVDQLLLGTLKAKHSPLRLLGAAMGTVVVDEAHALDPYMRMLLIRALEWLAALRTPVVVLSATLPPNRIRELVSAYQTGAGCDPHPDSTPAIGYPMWTAWTATDGYSVDSTEPRRRWDLRFDVLDTEASELTDRIAEDAVKASQGGDCVLVVRSTVAAAQQTYDVVRSFDPSLIPRETVDILHSRMPQHQKRDRSTALISRLGPDTSSRPQRMILVATQIVEQSLDVDFDLLITETAPMSALLQRAGRVRRHRPPLPGCPAQVKVMWPLDRNHEPYRGSPIYSKADLMAARTCLTQTGVSNSLDIRVPEDVPDLVARADVETAEQFDFDDSAIDEAEEATLAQLVRVDSDKAQGLRWSIPQPTADSPLADLTGSLDSDERHPGTRHRANSVLILPVTRSSEGYKIVDDGTPLDLNPRSTPRRSNVQAAFDASISVSYPSKSWVDLLHPLGGGWDRTPVSGALLLDISDGSVTANGYRLHVCSERGLIIERIL